MKEGRRGFLGEDMERGRGRSSGEGYPWAVSVRPDAGADPGAGGPAASVQVQVQFLQQFERSSLNGGLGSSAGVVCTFCRMNYTTTRTQPSSASAASTTTSASTSVCQVIAIGGSVHLAYLDVSFRFSVLFLQFFSCISVVPLRKMSASVPASERTLE